MRIPRPVLAAALTFALAGGIYLLGRHDRAANYPVDIDMLSMALAVIGAGTLASTYSVVGPADQHPIVAPGTSSLPATLPRRRPWPLIRKFGELPQFAILAIYVLFFAVIGMMVILEPDTPRGFHVSISSKLYADALANPAVPPLVVSVIERKGAAHFLVAGAEVPRDELHDALKKEFSRRPDWVVFVEGDRDVLMDDPVFVIDIAHQLHARAVMLTPDMKLGAKRPDK